MTASSITTTSKFLREVQDVVLERARPTLSAALNESAAVDQKTILSLARLGVIQELQLLEFYQRDRSAALGENI